MFVSKQIDLADPYGGWHRCGNCRKNEVLIGVNYDTDGNQGYLCLPCLRKAVEMLEHATTDNAKESKP
jgi:hypothetical protein